MIESNLKIRIISSIFLILVFLLIVGTNSIFFFLCTQLLLFLASWESIRLLNYRELIIRGRVNLILSRCKVSVYDFLIILFVNLFLISIFFSLYLLQGIISVLFFLLIIKYTKKSFIKFLILTYISFAFFCVGNFIKDRNFYDFLFFIICFAMVVDISAFFTGKFFGGRKLAVSLSPNKTLSGCIGAIVFPTLLCLIIFGKSDNFVSIIFFSIILSIVTQTGDLIESSFKRYCYVKDSSNIIPGHGGILDRIDSIVLLIIFLSIMKLFEYNFFFIV